MKIASVLLLALLTHIVEASPSPRRLALVGGTTFLNPSDEPIRDAIVVIENGKIAAVGKRGEIPLPANVEVIDCSGLAITAGFWNSHIHFFERKWTNAAAIPALELRRQLEEMLTKYGFTSVFDLGSNLENTAQIRRRIEAGELPGPRIRSVGEGLVAPGGAPSEQVLQMMGVMSTRLSEVPDAAQAVTASETLLGNGADGVKLFMKRAAPNGISFPDGATAAVVGVAHRLGKPVFVHPNTGEDVALAIRSGVDVIAHTTPASGPWNDALLGALRSKRVALTPTLSLWKFFMRHDRLSTQEQLVTTAVDQLRAWRAAGGTILFGTDVGAAEPDPGEEYALMAAAGMTSRQILASLTTAPAEHFGEGPRLGRIAPGFQADLVVLSRDPSDDPRAFREVRYTLRDGVVIYRRDK